MEAEAKQEKFLEESNRRILRAHAEGDEATLVNLYADAAANLEANELLDAACFFGTQAYVLALAAGSDRAAELRAWLRALGREE